MTPLQFFNILSNGIDPTTSKDLPLDHLCRQDDFLNQLYNLIHIKNELSEVIGGVDAAATLPNIKVTENPVLRSRLKEMRLRISREIKKPAFCVFNNKTLDELVVTKPASMNQLSVICGLGDIKIAKYGCEILSIVAQDISEVATSEKTIISEEKKINEKIDFPPKVKSDPSKHCFPTKIKHCIVTNCIQVLKYSDLELHLDLIELLEDYLEEKNHIDKVKTKKDGKDLMSFFKEVIDLLNEKKTFIPNLEMVILHIESSIRAVKERLPSLKTTDEVFRTKVIKYLQIKLPTCKCGEIMHVRESDNGYFYSCSLFPKCFGKKQLTKEQSNVVYSNSVV